LTKAIFIAAILLAIGLLLLTWFLLRLLRRLTFRFHEGKPKYLPPGVAYWAIITAMIILILSWSLFWTGTKLLGFKQFTPATNIGYIAAWNQGDPVKTIKFDFYPTGDSLVGTATSFYLSGNTWYVRGQQVSLSGFLTTIFGAEDYYKVTDFYGDFTGHKPPGINSPLLSHQPIEGGTVDFQEHLSLVGLFRGNFKVGEFESNPIKLEGRRNYNLILDDSLGLRIEPTTF